jgi:hypothetical protein
MAERCYSLVSASHVRQPSRPGSCLLVRGCCGSSQANFGRRTAQNPAAIYGRNDNARGCAGERLMTTGRVIGELG